MSGGPRRNLVIEIIAAGVFLALALLGIWVAPHFLEAGYLAHGVWDLSHHPRGIQTKIMTWWPPFCLIYDWMIAGFIHLR